MGEENGLLNTVCCPICGESVPTSMLTGSPGHGIVVLLLKLGPVCPGAAWNDQR